MSEEKISEDWLSRYKELESDIQENREKVKFLNEKKEKLKENLN